MSELELSNEQSKDMKFGAEEPSTIHDFGAIAINLKAESVQTSTPIDICNPKSNVGFTLDPNHSFSFNAILKDIRNEYGKYLGTIVYIIALGLIETLEEYGKRITLHAAKDKTGKRFIYVQKEPQKDGYTNSWISSGQKVVNQAKTGWLLRRSNKNKGEYETTLTKLDREPIEWFDLNDALNDAPSVQVIDSLEHPIVKELGVSQDNSGLLEDNSPVPPRF